MIQQGKLERARQALDMRKAGKTYDEIGKALSLSRQGAWKVVASAEQHFGEKVAPNVRFAKEWVGLTREEFAEILCDDRWQRRPELMLLAAQEKLREKNV